MLARNVMAQGLFAADERGFTLIELMVAVAVFAIGMLGLAALQGEGLRYNGSAYERTQAVILAADMADRIRASRDAAGANPPLYNGIASPPGAPASCYNVNPGCAPMQIRNADAFEWLTMINQTLPQANGSVVCNAAPCVAGSTYTISVSWTGRFGPKTHSITVQP